MASEGLRFLSLSLIPSPGSEEVQLHLLAPWGERGPGSVSQGTKYSCKVQLQGTVSPCPTPALRFAPWRAEAQHLLHGAVDGYAQEIVFANTLISPQLSTCYRNRCSEIMALECLQFILT